MTLMMMMNADKEKKAYKYFLLLGANYFLNPQ